MRNDISFVNEMFCYAEFYLTGQVSRSAAGGLRNGRNLVGADKSQRTLIVLSNKNVCLYVTSTKSEISVTNLGTAPHAGVAGGSGARCR